MVITCPHGIADCEWCKGKSTVPWSDRQAYERRLRELSEPPYGTDVTISQEPLDYWKTPSK